MNDQFEGVQPPSGAADRVRDEVTGLTEQAEDRVRDLFGGFVDIGDLVANAVVGARFGMSLAWVVVVGIIGICLFAEMSGRIAAVSRRPVFDLVRERLGPRAGLANLGASFLINVLTLAAEIGGASLALQLATGVNYLLWVPLVALIAWLVMWRVRFETMERVFGLAGLGLVFFLVVALAAVPLMIATKAGQ